VVSDELGKDAAQPAQTCQQNEEEIRQLLRSEAGQQALQTAKVDYQRVERAIGQLSDADLANVAERSRQVDRDFAVGAFGTTVIIAVALIVVLIIVLAVVFG
jgi:CHASE3 domain sensor protein